MSADPTFLGMAFTGDLAVRAGVWDSETGALIGYTIKVGDEPVMMVPIVPIPTGAVRFDAEAP